MRPVARIWMLLATLTVLASGCPAPRPTAPPGPSAELLGARAPTGDPAAFLDHLITLARAGDAQGWALQLSEARRARGPAYAARHLEAWRSDLLALADATPHPRASLERRGIGPGEALVLVLVVGDQRLMRVTVEDGALRIDEN